MADKSDFATWYPWFDHRARLPTSPDPVAVVQSSDKDSVGHVVGTSRRACHPPAICHLLRASPGAGDRIIAPRNIYRRARLINASHGSTTFVIIPIRNIQ